MKALFVALGYVLFPLIASAQSQMSVAEQRLAVCTVGEARLQQMLQDAQAKIAELEKKAAVPADPGGQPK